MSNFLYDFEKEKNSLILKWFIIILVALAFLFFSPKTFELLPGDDLNVVKAAEPGDKIDEMRKISDDVSEKGVDEDAIPGNQWSALGADSSFFASFTKATERVTYDDLKKRNKNVGAAGSYGFVLDQSGLDHSFVDGDSGAIFSTLGRYFFGAVIMLGYFLQAAVNYLFTFIATIADYINVFKWFTDSPIDKSSPFAGVQKVVRSVVVPLQSLGIMVMTLLFAVSSALAIMGWRVSQRNPRTGVGSGLVSSAGKLLLRFFVILIAPLLLATIYSGLMTAVKDAYSGTSASDYAVYSNLVDFDKWVKYSRLALPDGELDGFNYTLDAGKVGYATHGDVLNLNAKAAGLKNARDTKAAYDLDSVGTVLGTTNEDPSKVEKDGVNDWAMSVVSKWMRLETVTSASYESYARNQYLSTLKENGDVDNKEYKKLITNDGALTVENKQFKTGKPEAPVGDEYNYAIIGNHERVGLSSLGMYNYLSTTFDSSSFTFTRTDLMVGKAFTPYHASVGLAGRGIVAFGNYTIMFATIYSIAILGIMFAMLAINALIVSVPKALGALGGSIFGSLTNFIKMIMVIFVLAVELIGGAILYLVSQKIIVGISMLGDGIAGQGTKILMKSPDNVALASGMSNTLYGALNIIIALLLMFVSFILIRYRGKILGGFASTFESAMNNIFGMFESTQQGSQAFQGGSNGMYTTNKEGKNQFSRPDGTSTDFSRSRNEEGASGFNKGAQNRSSGVADPKSAYGKAVNAKAAMTDAIRAKEAELGRPLTSGEKKKEVAKQMAMKAGAGAIRTTGGVLGSDKLAGVGDDMDSSRQAKINNSLANEDKKKQEVEELAKGASMGDQGETQDIKDINSYADAQEGSVNTVSDDDLAVETTQNTNVDNSNEFDSAVNPNQTAEQESQQLNEALNTGAVATGNQAVDSSAVEAHSNVQGYADAKSELATANNELAKAQTSGNEEAIESATAKQNMATAKVQEAHVASAIAGEKYANNAKENAQGAKSIETAAKSKLQNALSNPDIATQEEVAQMKEEVKQAEQQTALANKAVTHADQLQNAVKPSQSNTTSTASTGSTNQSTKPNQQRTNNTNSASKATNGPKQVSTSGQKQSSPIPTYSSTKDSNATVKQAQAKYSQAQQVARAAPPEQREKLEAKAQRAQHELKNAQAGASRYFESQPAVGMAKMKHLNSKLSNLPTNKQAREGLAAVRDAHIDYRNVAQMQKPTPSLVKEAKMRLATAKKEAVSMGMRKDVVDNISTVKQSLDQLNQSQTEFITGTGDEFIAESVKTTINTNKQNEMKNTMDRFKNTNLR